MGENLCKNTLEYGGLQMLRARLISFCIAAVFVLGSAHFFLMNVLQFIFVITGQPTNETYWNMQYVLEVFETRALSMGVH